MKARAHIWIDPGASIRAYIETFGEEPMVALRIGDVLLHLGVEEADRASMALQSVIAVLSESATACTVAQQG